MKDKIYIILLNYNGWMDTIQCLESILKSDYQNYQIIVIDNDSPNDSMNYIINWAEGKQEVIYDEKLELRYLIQPFKKKPLDYIFYNRKEEALKREFKKEVNKVKNPIIFIQAGENRGFAAGNNIGIKYALKKNDFEYIWLLNNDTVIKNDTLSKLHEYSKQNSNSLISSRLLNEDNTIQADGGNINKYFLTSSHINSNKNLNDKIDYKIPNYLVGASLFINKKILKDIGLLSEEYFLYYEDLDYSLKAIKKGYALKVCHESIVYHKDGSSTKKVNKDFIVNHYFRNRLKIAKKFNFTLFTVKMGMCISIFKRLIYGNINEAKIIWNILKNEQ